ncbi:MAG: DUF1553 domain-containing protein [Planctomycetales bacterium]|nr:DUF1553 domain-containing protein [Planctomycetales bacterium]
MTPQSTRSDDRYPRSVYTFWKRTAPSGMLKFLDAPDQENLVHYHDFHATPLHCLGINHEALTNCF